MASGAARRYVQAIVEVARDQQSFDAWQQDLQRLGAIIEDPAVAAYLQNPSVQSAEKKKAVDIVLRDAQAESRNLVHMLVERHRTGIISELVTLFDEAVLAEKGIVMADVTTAEPLDADAQHAVRERLSSIVGKGVELRMHTDPEIIGGLIAQIGDEVIDGSVQTRLRRLRARLKAS